MSPSRAMRAGLVLVLIAAMAPTKAGHADAKASRSFPIRLIDNRVFVAVSVDGQGPFAFILDTGSSGTTIDAALARRLNLSPLGSGQADGAGESKVAYETAHLDRLTLGDIEIGAMDVPALDGAALARAVGFQRFDGVLGAEIFKTHVVTIDAGRGRLFVQDSAQFRPEPTAVPVPIALNADDMPIVDGRFEGIEGRFEIDTGDRSSLTLFGPFWRAHRLDAVPVGPIVTAMTGYGVGGPIRSLVRRTNGLSLGAVVAPPAVVRLSLQSAGAFTSGDYAGSIGMGVLKRYVASFDYARHEMWLDKAAGYANPDRYDRSGSWLGLGDGRTLTVLDVVDGGPASMAGLRRGDTVVAIDGITATPDSLFALRERLKRPDLATAVFDIMRDGRAETLRLELRDLIAP